MRCRAALITPERQEYLCHRDAHEDAVHYDAARGVRGVAWTAGPFEPFEDFAPAGEFARRSRSAEDLT